jgi:acetyl esterase
MPYIEDLEYLATNGVALLARFYRPEGRGPLPAVLEVHGGAWTAGDRLNNAAIGEHLAAHGIAILSIDFRMPPGTRYPETVADVNHGIRFLKTNAARFATRPELVGGIGTSSGGHLLLLNVLRPRDRRYAALPPAPMPDSPSPSSAGRWPIPSPAIAPCASAATPASSTLTTASGHPRRRWPKAARN